MLYQGGCHCGTVRFEVNLNLESALTCNCSYCQKRGSMLAFTSESNFTLHQGESKLTEYRFNTGTIQHLFCAGCGIEAFAKGKMPDGTKTVAINVRCLDGIEPDTIAVTKYDGRSS